MKHAAWYIAFATLTATGCAQNQSHTRVASTIESRGNVDSRTSAPTESGQKHFVSVAESAEPGEDTPQEWSGWKPTSSIDKVADASLGNGINQVSHQQTPFTDEGAASLDTQLSSLDSFEQLALSSNPTLIELQANVDAANGRWLQVGLNPNPVVSVSAQEIGNERSAGQYGALVGQKFVTANKLELNRNAATWQVKQAEQELAAQRLRVLTDVRRGFYSVLVAQERLKVAEELQDIARKSVKKAQELIKFQEPATVLTQAEIEAELAAVLVDNSRIQRDAQWRRLAAVTGQPDLPSQTVKGRLTADAPEVVWELTLDRVRHESPEVAAAVAEVEQSRWALQRASVQATPDVTFQAGVFYDDSSSDPFATLQMSMPLPVYDWNQGGIAEAQANVIAAEQAVQRVELGLQQRLATVYQKYEQARKQASRYETTILRKARRNLDLNRQGYESGDSAYLAVLTAQRSYSQAQLAWLNALEQLWSATVQMEGLLLSGSLK